MKHWLATALLVSCLVGFGHALPTFTTVGLPTSTTPTPYVDDVFGGLVNFDDDLEEELFTPPVRPCALSTDTNGPDGPCQIDPPPTQPPISQEHTIGATSA